MYFNLYPDAYVASLNISYFGSQHVTALCDHANGDKQSLTMVLSFMAVCAGSKTCSGSLVGLTKNIEQHELLTYRPSHPLIQNFHSAEIVL